MKNRMKKQWSIIFFVCLIQLWITAVFADFVVRSEYQSAEPFGNAQAVVFNQAITGRSPLTPEEELALARRIPLNEYDRFYGRVRVNSSSLSVDQFKNKSTGVDANATVLSRHFTRSQIGLELAIGYNWEEGFRGDLEYLVNRNINFTANPILSNSTRSLAVELKNNTILGNVYYDFEGFDRFRPYLTAGIGGSVVSVKSSLTPAPAAGGSSDKRWLTFSWQAGAGFRVSMFTRWFVDVSYRYIRLGNMVRIYPNTEFRVNANYSMNAISFGVIYLF